MLDARIVSGRQELGSDLPRRNHQLIELDVIVAERTGDRGAAFEILGDKGPDHRFFEVSLEVDHVERKIQVLGHATRVIHVIQRAAAALDGLWGGGVRRGQAALVPKLHRQSDDLVILRGQHGGHRRAVHTSAHGHHHGGPAAIGDASGRDIGSISNASVIIKSQYKTPRAKARSSKARKGRKGLFCVPLRLGGSARDRYFLARLLKPAAPLPLSLSPESPEKARAGVLHIAKRLEQPVHLVFCILPSRLKRRLPRARWAATPMAVSTCEGSTDPAEHADPVETAMPFRSSAITSDSPST